MSTRAGESGICPHCGTGVRFETPNVDNYGTSISQIIVRADSKAWLQILLSSCPVCGYLIIEAPRLGEPHGGQNAGPGLIYPKGAARPLPPEILSAAPNLAADFAEAVAV